MDRSVRRKKELDSFSIDIDTLDNLLEKLLELFDDKKNRSVSIEFKLKQEELNFDSVEEIKQYAKQKQVIP